MLRSVDRGGDAVEAFCHLDLGIEGFEAAEVLSMAAFPGSVGLHVGGEAIDLLGQGTEALVVGCDGLAGLLDAVLNGFSTGGVDASAYGGERPQVLLGLLVALGGLSP